MIRFPARLAVPLVMVPLFAISFVRVETRWRDRAVELDARDMSWDLSLYVPYHIRQGLDLHWLGLTAPAMLNLLPRSMTKMSSTPLAGPLPYGAAFASVAAVWFLFGLWMKRLNSGRRLQNRWARGAVLTAALGFGTEAWLVAFRGVRVDWEGPTATWPAGLLPLGFVFLGLTESGVLAPMARWRWTPVAMACLMTAAWYGAVLKHDQQLRAYKARIATPCEARRDAGCFDLPFHATPEVQDAMFLHLPALLPAALVVLPFGGDIPAGGIRDIVTHVVVWLYWWLVWSLVLCRWPVDTKLVRLFRALAAVVTPIGFVLCLAGWHVGGAHGPHGQLGGALSLAFLCAALWMAGALQGTGESQSGAAE